MHSCDGRGRNQNSLVYRRYCCAVGLAYNQNMKRLVLSLFYGFAMPVTYNLALGLLLVWTKNLSLIMRLSYPVSWPMFVFFRLLPSDAIVYWLRPEKRLSLVLLVISCDGLLYSIPIYFLLWGFSTRKRKAKRVDLPPDHRDFLNSENGSPAREFI